jgi:hypothetical protein
MSTEVAETSSNVPALRHDPATTIIAEDVALPRLYIGQDMHQAVQDGDVKRGEIFTALGSDDPQPEILKQPVEFFVLGLRKGKSISIDGELFRYDYDDPDAPANAWITYTYTVAIPSVNKQLPYRWLLTRTGRPTAQRINLVLGLDGAERPPYVHGFSLTTREQKNNKGRWFVPVVAKTEPGDEDVAVAKALFEQYVAAGERVEQRANEPQI